MISLKCNGTHRQPPALCDVTDTARAITTPGQPYADGAWDVLEKIW